MQQIHVLSINCILPLCLSVQTHTHTHLCGSTAFLEWQKPCIIFCYSLLQMEPSFHDLAASRRPPPAYVFIYLDLSHFPSFLPSPPLCMFMFIQTHLPLFLPPPLTQSLPLCPAFVTRLVSITTATFLSCLTIFNQKQRKTEMRWGRERGREWGRRRLQVRWCIRWLRKQFYPPKETNRGWGWSAEWKLALTLTVWSAALCGWHS